MLILFVIVCFVLVVYGMHKRKDEGFFIPVTLLTVITITAFLFVSGILINSRTLDEKIVMYTEENQKIEERIGTLVKEYMNYESNTYIETKNESAISLVSLYPELKTDELVKEQISIHTANNSLIKTLKHKKLNVSSYKFWLYFGG